MNRHETLKEYLTALYRAEAVVTDNPSAPLYFNGSRSLTDYRIHLLDVELPIITCLRSIRQEEEKSKATEAQMQAVRTALEQKLSFENGVDAALVTTILDHIVVKKGSTRERVELEIFLKFGDPQRVIFSHRKTSDCFNPCYSDEAPGKQEQKDFCVKMLFNCRFA